MKIFLFVLGVSLIGLTGCSVKTVPVSSSIETTLKNDSIHTEKESLKDSSYHKETVEEKTLPGATVGITLSKQALDSLILALGNLPSSVPKVIYYTDPKSRVILSTMLDSLNNFRIQCEATEQRYYQTTIEQGRYIEKLKEKIDSVSRHNTQLTTVVNEKQERWLTRTWRSIKSFGFGSFLMAFLVMVLAVGAFSNFNFLSIIKKIFSK